MGGKNPKRSSSRILAYIINSLIYSWHQNMLYWLNEKEKLFEIKLVDKKSSRWKTEDISLLKELDQLFGDRYIGQKNYEQNSRRRFQSNMNQFCERGLLKKMPEEKESKSIRIERYKITEKGLKIKELNNSSLTLKHGLQENEQAMETQPEDTACPVSPPSTPIFGNLQVVPLNSPVLIVGNTCFLVAPINGVTSSSGKRNEVSINSSSTSYENGSKMNYIYDNKFIKSTMYGNGLCDIDMYGNELPSNVVHLEGSFNNAPVCSQADREVQTQSEEIPNNCFMVPSVNGVTNNSGKKYEFSTNSSSTSHGNGSKMNDIYNNKFIKNTMYGNGLCDAVMYGNELPRNVVHLEESLNSAPVCSPADREVQTQSEEIPNNPLLGDPDICSVNSPSETQSFADGEVRNFAASPLGDFAMETFSEIHLPDSPKWRDFSDLLEMLEEENDDELSEFIT